METLSGKIAVVTGGTRGIGRAIAESLLRDGASVMINGRTRESVDKAVAELRPLGKIFGVAADVSDAVQVRRLFEAVDREFSGVDILVNNAGAGAFRKVAEMSPDEWRKNIELNLNGPFYCSREALTRFLKRGGGSIVNIASLAAKNAFTTGAGYNASKAGLVLFGEAMMLDHRHDNVRICSILPGSVDTEFSGNPATRAGDTSWMIAAEDVAAAAMLALRMPARTMVSQIDLRPSRPRK